MDSDDDYSVVVDGPVIGRIYRESGGTSSGKWHWFLQKPIGASGIAETLDEAKQALGALWRTKLL
jgi:hypothetical protein